MKRYNEGKKNRTEINRTAYEKRYRSTKFYMNPRQPRLLAAKDVAHLLHLLRSEVLSAYEAGTLKCTRFQNGYPRFWAEDVFAFAKAQNLWNADIQEYADDLDKIIEMRERDPAQYVELCRRLTLARAVLAESKGSTSNGLTEGTQGSCDSNHEEPEEQSKGSPQGLHHKLNHMLDT